MDADEVLDFWFSGGKQMWFQRSDETDTAIRQQFGEAHAQAVEGRLDGWAEASARGRLALIILLDQFSRNLHRDSGAAWDHDRRAQALTREGIECGHETELTPIQRAFLYMPLMHAEDRQLQDLGVERFTALAEESGGEVNFVKFAVMHRDIVAKFGRFPHRNALLDRTSTGDEADYLEGDVPTFGVKK